MIRQIEKTALGTENGKLVAYNKQVFKIEIYWLNPKKAPQIFD